MNYLTIAHPNPLIGGCPRCGGKQLCPCKNCAKSNAGQVTWIWLTDGETIECGHCGEEAHADFWLEWDFSSWHYQQSSEHHASCF